VQCAKTSCLESVYINRSMRVTAIEFSICRPVRDCKNTDGNDTGVSYEQFLWIEAHLLC
jgi:hypothetical protein